MSPLLGTDNIRAAAAAPNPSRQAAAPAAAFLDPQVHNFIRKLAFYAMLGVVFLRYSLLHEYLAAASGVNARLLYFFAVPAMLGVLTTGGLRRMFARRAAYYWLAFLVWICLSIPFSAWRGGSAQAVLTYVRADFPLFVLIAGLTMTWKECRMVLYTIGLSGIVNAALGWFTSSTYGQGRVGLEFGTIENPNDFAAHLLMVLPLVAFLIARPMRVPLMGWVVRAAALAGLFYGSYLVVASGSRGALLAIMGVLLFLFWDGGARTRIALLVVIPIAVSLLLVVLPRHTISRLESYSTTSPNREDEATDSARLRRALLEESITAALTHPILGVGVGIFDDYEGGVDAKVKWINAHNSYGQVASEDGIPALIFYVAGIVSPWLLIRRIKKRLPAYPELNDIGTACLCLSVGLVGYSIAIFFVNFAYFFYLPAFAGFAVAFAAAFDREAARIDARKTIAPAAALAQLRPAPAVLAALPRNRFRFGRYR